MESNDPAAIYLPDELNQWLIEKAYAEHGGSFRQAMFAVLFQAKHREDADGHCWSKLVDARRPVDAPTPRGRPEGVAARPQQPGLRSHPGRLGSAMLGRRPGVKQIHRLTPGWWSGIPSGRRPG
ncbi:MAG TPA: hypothetical protein VGK54_07870 [Chloroflexota bacterium]